MASASIRSCSTPGRRAATGPAISSSSSRTEPRCVRCLQVPGCKASTAASVRRTSCDRTRIPPTPDRERQKWMRSSGMEHAKSAVKRLFVSLDARFTSKEGAPTGIASLDAAGGLRAGELAVLAGHPGAGKTSLAISMATHTAMQDGSVLWFSLAETTLQTTERLLRRQAGMWPQPLRTGQLQRQDMTNLTYAAATVSKWAFQLEDAIDLTAAQIRERAREWRGHETSPRALIVIDYLQLLADECDATAVLRSLL